MADPVVTPALRFLKSALTRPLALRGVPRLALAETQRVFDNARWFWTDDNAKALELLAQPVIWNADPDFATAILEFVLAMSEGTLISRRAAAPQLQVLQADARAFRVVNAFCAFSGDLSRGMVEQGGRFNDGRDRIAARHTGNLVEFRHRGRAYCLDVEDRITDFGITRLPGAVVLHHESTIELPASLLRRPRRIGTLRYEYRIAEDSAVLRLAVSLRTAPGVALSRVRVTTALDGMSDNGRPGFGTLTVGHEGAYRQVTSHAEGPGVLHRGPATHLGFIEGGAAGFATGLHVRPDAPDRLLSVKATARPHGRQHWAVTRYGTDRLGPEATFAIGESRLLTLGGLYRRPADYAALLAEPERSCGIDPSISYDYGVELNAVATICRHAARGDHAVPLPPERLAALRAWYDRHLEAWFEGLTPVAGDAAPPFVRGLAFVLLSLDAMRQLPDGERYGTPLTAGLDLLLARQQTGPHEGAFVDAEPAGARLDGHAAALLALARLAGPEADPRVGPALVRALGAVRLGTVNAQLGDQTVPHDTVVVRARAPDGSWTQDGGFWSYKLGLLLRAMQAVLAGEAAGRVTLMPQERQRAARLAEQCRGLLRAVMRDRPEGLEFLTSPFAAEANSETQAWVILGLLAPEAAATVADPSAGGLTKLPSVGDSGQAEIGINDLADCDTAGGSSFTDGDSNTAESVALREDTILRHNVKILAAEAAHARYAAGLAGERAPRSVLPIRIGISSRVCRQADVEHDWLRHWCGALRMAPLYHRKVWEDCFVLQALWEADMLAPGRRGLGFGVGREWLPALFAGQGAEVVATDLDTQDARARDWLGTGQHAEASGALFRPELVTEANFRRLVTHRAVDMAAIPPDLANGGFDFLWSVCSLEHLGTLDTGEAFVVEAMRCLRPGGIAVHTTEYNLNPAGGTVRSGPTVLYQRRHLNRLAGRLASAGHTMLPLDEADGDGLLDRLIDLPPFGRDAGMPDAPHLRLALAGYPVTAVGIVVRAAAA